ncbi:MAG: CvpA family protein [Blastocatellia bacterium]|nr:CvpA family protein [Blastocatellia bacterium]
MTTFDYIVIAVVGLSLLAGLIKGFVQSVWGLASALVGVILASLLYPHLQRLVRPWTESEVTAMLMAFLLIFVGVVAGGIATGRMTRAFLKKTHLSWIDHLAGGAFGLARGWLICSVVYVALTAFPVQPDIVAQARSAPYLHQGAEVLTMATSKELRDQFFEGYQYLQHRELVAPMGRRYDTKGKTGVPGRRND